MILQVATFSVYFPVFTGKKKEVTQHYNNGWCMGQDVSEKHVFLEMFCFLSFVKVTIRTQNFEAIKSFCWTFQTSYHIHRAV